MFELQTYQPADPWMRRFWSDPFSFFSGSGGMTVFGTDIADNGDSYLLEADLPGFRKEDIHLDLQGDTLTISARRDDEREERREQYIRCERCSGSYQRSFDMSGVPLNRSGRRKKKLAAWNPPIEHPVVMNICWSLCLMFGSSSSVTYLNQRSCCSILQRLSPPLFDQVSQSIPSTQIIRMRPASMKGARTPIMP